MKPANTQILTINGGSSSIKFALFEAGDSLRRILDGGIERIGSPEADLSVNVVNPADNYSRLVTAPDHAAAVETLMDWIEERSWRDALAVRVIRTDEELMIAQLVKRVISSGG